MFKATEGWLSQQPGGAGVYQPAPFLQTPNHRHDVCDLPVHGATITRLSHRCTGTVLFIDLLDNCGSKRAVSISIR